MSDFEDKSTLDSSKQQESKGFNLGGALGVSTGTEALEPVEKAENFGGTVIRLIKYLKPQFLQLLLMILLAAVGAWFLIWVPDIMKKVTNALVESLQFFVDISPTGNNRLYNYIAPVLWTCASLYVLNALFQFASGLIAASMSQRVVRRMRTDVKNKFDKVALAYFDATPTGEILSRVTNDIEMVSITLQESINQIISGVMTVIGVFIMMLRIDWLLSVIALVSLPILLIVSRFIIKRSQVEFARQQNRIGELNGHIEEMYTGHAVIKLYNREAESINTYEQINKELKKATRKSQFLAGIILPSIKFINNLAYVFICVIGGFRAGDGRITIGDIQALLQYTRNFAQPIEQVSNIANTIQTAMAAAERVFQVFDLDEMTSEINLLSNVAAIEGQVEIENLAFSYDKSKQLITNLSLHVNAGESIAIVGPTGAGKTTLVNLLMRFYDIDAGAIYIDGVNTSEYTRDALRSLYGMVLQDTWLFNGTVADNIAYGNEGASRDEIEVAAKKAYAHTFIEGMESGYDTMLNEDASNISQGQKQLLTIARAILKDPKIIILDEATSSVDTRTEKYIQSAMLAMMEGKTSFVIAHRLSTIKSAALILVMNHGDVVEQGNHDTLMKRKGFYYELYQSQFAGVTDANQNDEKAERSDFKQT
ncbi:MAG: ABC transporter ATP-binding protein/permease [Christensenellaceae bacterium]|jgi:ATP-binding cassette subfamily B protein|nr:ABC transporter ATP-binding protein/permease [Christensenellaceae bacterium]